MSNDRWDVIKAVCIKQYETLKIGYRYDIKGRGNLEFNNDPNVGGRTGHGYCIEDQNYPMMNRRMFGVPKPILYYFTEKEMDEYFITEEEDYKITSRDRKIKDVLDE